MLRTVYGFELDIVYGSRIGRTYWAGKFRAALDNPTCFYTAFTWSRHEYFGV